MKVRITLAEELLGTASANPQLHQEHVASKAPGAPSMEEEVAALGVEIVERMGMSIFARTNNGTGEPMLWDYQIKGFFKDACSMLSRVPDTRSGKLKAFRKVIDGLIFPQPRKLVLHLPPGGMVARCQRPLRVQGPQGERVCLADSETVPEGTWLEVDIKLLDPSHTSVVEEWLDYGQLRGLGQWRNSGKGRFTWELIGDGKAGQSKA